ncbi:MAG: pitrilysin family protein [bacterium]|nr:pitrilysin family protein [bacterium]
MRFRKTVLPNGLRLVTVPRTDSKAVTVLFLVKVGSRQESSSINGISHFIEHLMFKGTEKRPTTLDISKALDQVGAEYNAFTGKDHTGYYITVNKAKTRLALDILSDMLQNSKFDSKELERERTVIIEEINMYEDNPMMYVEEIFEQLFYGKNHPLGQLIAGPRSVIRKVSRADMMRYIGKHYSARNSVLAVAGAIDKTLMKQAKELFGGIGSGSAPKRFSQASHRQTAPRLKVLEKKTEQIQICLGFPGLSYTNSQYPALELLSVILGGNMSSRLFINIRERLGLAYFVKASANAYEDSGTFAIQAGLDKKRFVKAVAAILKEVTMVKNEGVTEDELKKARDFLRGKMVLGLEDSSSLASWAGKMETFDHEILTPEQRYAQYRKVTPSQIQKLANRLFLPKWLNVAVIGSAGNPAALRQIIRQPF